MSKQQNLIIILSDEHQARAMGCVGHPFVKTPHLDKLAARSTLYSNAYTPSPICVPARAAFATGRYAHQISTWDNAMPYTGDPKGWGHALQDAGVRVESIGKLHYRKDDDPTGFDKLHLPMQVAGGTGMVWASFRKLDERFSHGKRMLGDYIGPGESPYTQYDTRITDLTVDWLQQAAEQEQPWCLYVGLVAPHFPLICPQEFYNLYPEGSLPEPKLHPTTGYQRHPWVELQNALMDSEANFTDEAERQRAFSAYYGLCSWLDSNVGEIMQTLEATGLADNTTVIYSSDHGDNVGARGLWGKSNMYEEAAAVPMLVARPGQTAEVTTTPVSLVDIAATVLDHFNLPEDPAYVGNSLYQLPAHDQNRVVYSEYHAVGAVTGAFMVRQGDWKLIHYHDFEPELFNLNTDSEELTNLSADPAYADMLQHMYAILAEICDTKQVEWQAHEDQDAMIEAYGGREVAITLGAPAATPAPK
ncbi:MAG TPA: sulfatase [Oceanospirillaceae bacterium]|nr:sulfatase [Oceanospirillaceae bacterium]